MSDYRGEKYKAFNNLYEAEEKWAKLEGFFKARGYNFRSRFRNGWTPSWYTTGKSPLVSEDGDVLRVHFFLRFHRCSVLT